MNQTAAIDERVRACYAVFDERMRLGPDPRVRNPQTSQVYLNFRQPTPSFGDTVQGIFAGQLNDPRAAMKMVKDLYERAFDEAIAAAQSNGAQVSRDDYVFPNWDPTQDYPDANYQAL